MRSELRIHALELPVYIGLTEDERRRAQSVEFDLLVEFEELPKACESDEITGTVCYEEVANSIEDLVGSKKFKLIEHLGFKTMEILQPKFSTAKKIDLSVKKLEPPLRQKNQGASFRLKWKKES